MRRWLLLTNDKAQTCSWACQEQALIGADIKSVITVFSVNSVVKYLTLLFKKGGEENEE